MPCLPELPPIPPEPVPVDPEDFASRYLDDERADLFTERRLDAIVRLPGRFGLGHPLRGYVQRRLGEVLGDIDQIDADVATLGARRRDATRLARRYRELLVPRAEQDHRTRSPHWHDLGRPVGTGELLSGRELREACTAIVLEADDAMTIPEIRAALLALGCDAAPRPRSTSPHNKAIADALADAVRAGALRRLARGVFGPAGGNRRAERGWLERETTLRRKIAQQRRLGEQQRAAAEAERPAS